ncbi:MAG: Ribose-5-phosphate isomerase B [Candidatus Nomurabacteria bacterium GW2011_GWB1_40_7]|uniref:Ribose-5-phosphate isomerase B n=1 Tax=Candidatus Nomurabacteria bacterium GW2011_GWB1_40_7 TaxID=1618744 RepID=A0A0G0VCJ8_9BACT|nr:MAG: Ribose-5-phosphate isomerase B [Candidatus Nomurabacteria bacterium GW2011_GWB1_40_7]
MKIYIGTDHAGYVLKEKLVSTLKAQGHEVFDEGAYSYNETDDYPDFVSKVARAVSEDEHDSTKVRGIILGGTGQGEAIVANRFPHVRAIVYYGKSTPVVEDESGILARSRAHNDANVLSLGARYFTEEDMMEIVNFWLNAPYSGDERHIRRLKKIDNIKID